MSTAPDPTQLISTQMVELSWVESAWVLWLHPKTIHCNLHCGTYSHFTPLHVFSTHESSHLHAMKQWRRSVIGLGRFGFFNFGSIRFGFQSQVLGFGFFGFGIPPPQQCKSILVCENTKTESINFHKKFQLKYIDLVWRSYSLHLGVVNSFALSVIGPSGDLS